MKHLIPAHQLNIGGIMGFLLGCSISTSQNPIFLFPDKSVSLLAREWHLVKAFQGLPINSCNEEVVVAVFLMMRKVGLPSVCSAAVRTCTWGCFGLFGPDKLAVNVKKLVWWLEFVFSPFCSIGTGGRSSQGWCGVYQWPDRLPSSRLLSAQRHHVSYLSLWLKPFARGAN